MRTYETNIIVNDPTQLVLNNVPFEKGTTVHITIEQETEQMRLAPKKDLQEAWKRLSVSLEKDEHYQSLTEEEIAEEIAAYRRGE